LQAHAAHAQAVGPTVVAFMGREDLDRFVLRNPEVGLRMMDLLAERLGSTSERLAEVANKEVVACRGWWTTEEATACPSPTPTRSWAR
jgi:CRP-like cAMP-binding protein